MSLLNLYDSMEKTAAAQGLDVNDEWSELAAQYGMTKEAFMDKLAEEQVAEEVELVKEAREATYLGKCMSYGYMDTLQKVAKSNAVVAGIPELFVKVASASLHGICSNMIKAANTPQRAQAIFNSLAK